MFRECGRVQLPHELSRLHHLETLAFRSCRVEHRFGPDFRLPRLRNLNLWDCGLETLPDWIANQHSLQRLTLGPNPLTSLPEWLDRLPRLKHLSY